MLLREANEKDVKLLFDWANDPVVRENALNKEKISWENHQKWFAEKGFSPNSHIYILEDKDIPVGQIRFDKVEGHYEIDYSIDLKYRGKGYGYEIVQKGVHKLPNKGKTPIVAKVKQQNVASSKVFEKCGFSLIGKEMYHEESYHVFQLNANLNAIIVLLEKNGTTNS